MASKPSVSCTRARVHQRAGILINAAFVWGPELNEDEVQVKHDRICVGALAGAFGVKGDVRLKSFCTTPEAIASYAPLYTEDGSKSFHVTLIKAIPNGFAARLSGISSREAAEALKGTRLYADRDRLPDLPDDEFYHADLIGLDVVDTGGASLGNVTAVHNHGAGDLLELRLPEGKTVLLPFTQTAVPTIDLKARRIVADPPDGIFSQNDGEGQKTAPRAP